MKIFSNTSMLLHLFAKKWDKMFLNCKKKIIVSYKVLLIKILVIVLLAGRCKYTYNKSMVTGSFVRSSPTGSSVSWHYTQHAYYCTTAVFCNRPLNVAAKLQLKPLFLQTNIFQVHLPISYKFKSYAIGNFH